MTDNQTDAQALAELYHSYIDMLTYGQGNWKFALANLIPGYARLSPTELKVMRGLATGLDANTYTSDTGVLIATVRTQIEAIKEKLELENVAQIAPAYWTLWQASHVPSSLKYHELAQHPKPESLPQYDSLIVNYKSLSQAERAVFPYLAYGYSDKEIASIRQVQRETIKTQRTNIEQKFGIKGAGGRQKLFQLWLPLELEAKQQLERQPETGSTSAASADGTAEIKTPGITDFAAEIGKHDRFQDRIHRTPRDTTHYR